MIGERLAAIRKFSRMGQNELANKLGISKHSISMYENNKSSPSDDGYVTIAETFNISVDYLLGLVDEPYSFKRHDAGTIRIPKAVPEEVKAVLDDFIEYLWDKYGKSD